VSAFVQINVEWMMPVTCVCIVQRESWICAPDMLICHKNKV